LAQLQLSQAKVNQVSLLHIGAPQRTIPRIHRHAEVPVSIGPAMPCVADTPERRSIAMWTPLPQGLLIAAPETTEVASDAPEHLVAG